MVEVGREFAGEHLFERVPGVASPPHTETPFRQGFIEDELTVPTLGDDRGGLHRALDGRGDDRRMLRKAFGAVLGLTPAGG